MNLALGRAASAWLVFLAFAVVTVAVYAGGVHGGFLFDDFPNIVDNPGVQPSDASLPSLVRSALSSPSSEFKRPLASLTFAANFLTTGMDPAPMKITNVVIHLLNGLLVFLIARCVIRILVLARHPGARHGGDVSAALVAGAWLLLPINLTAVLYVVQRMESLANLFVLSGLLGYLCARRAMQTTPSRRYFLASALSITVPTVLGLLAKETAVMLPLYAFAADGILFRWRSGNAAGNVSGPADRRVLGLFAIVLWVPMAVGLAWLLPGLLKPSGWSTRDFTMSTRLLTEARVVMDYLVATVLPTPPALPFYYDGIEVSQSWASPWTTLPCVAGVGILIALAWCTRRRAPLFTLGMSLFVAAQLLTATILPLELVYEHRNYFASFGVMMAIVPSLAQPGTFLDGTWANRLRLIGPSVLAALILLWTGMTASTSAEWGSPLALAQELASRAPNSPRAQYELGRTYIIVSRYKSTSPFVDMAYAPLEKAASLPNAGVLPEQALIFLNARMHRPIKEAWWESMETKLRTSKVTVQDESALSALVQCDRSGECDLPTHDLLRIYAAAISHPERSPRLVANYGDFAWNQLNDHTLAAAMLSEAVRNKPNEPAYRITLIRMLMALDRRDEAKAQRDQLAHMNVGGALDNDLRTIDAALAN